MKPFRAPHSALRVTRRVAAGFAAGALMGLLAACSGVPLASWPKLMQLPGQLADANPADLRVALLLDQRLVPTADTAPQLVLKLTPQDPKAFPAIDRKLPLQLATSTGAVQGLDAAPPGRRWWVYSLPTASQAELLRIQTQVKQARAQATGATGGTLSLGLAQDDLAAHLAAHDPTLAASRWATWMQVRRADGFFEVWTGTLAQVRNATSQAPGPDNPRP
jgi:hypothetical protein